MLCSGMQAAAQQATELGSGGCGTVTPPSEVQKIYDFVQHNPAAYAKGTGATDTIPLSIHIVGTDLGGGYFPVASVARLICQLNIKYAPVSFYFYVKWPLHYINNSAYYQHDFWTGENMMNNNNVPGTVNVYIVQDPAGNCGYYTYGGDAVAIGKNCSGDNSTTLAHELGHFFSLPHTFYGWENGNTPSNPEAIRRSGPGTNCNSSGDGFCDTDADYLSVRWNCPYVTSKTDAFGDQYHLDSSMYMSYSSDNCQSRFSAQQIAQMQNNLHTAGNRAGIHNAIPPSYLTLSTPAVSYPVDTMYTNAQYIVWNKVPGADYYHVKIALTNTIPLQTILTADTVLIPSFTPQNNQSYVVTVSPLNAYDLCMTHTTTRKYVYSPTSNGALSTGTVMSGDDALTLFPNPLSEGRELSLRFNQLPAGAYQVAVSDISGRIVYTGTLEHNHTNETMQLALPLLNSGVYYVRCSKAGFQQIEKLVIAR